MADSTHRLSPERLAEIRRLGDDEFRTVLTMDNAVDDLLAEVDRLRDLLVATARATASLLQSAKKGTVQHVAARTLTALADREQQGGAR